MTNSQILALRWLFRGSVALSVGLAALATWQWLGSERKVIQSQALGEDRIYRVFNPSSDGPMIYSLDGHQLRNSLAPAIMFSVSSILRGASPPTIVAVYSGQKRDQDFPNASSTPTFWRPQISGRAKAFDAFLLQELLPTVETAAPTQKGMAGRYLMGHSLSGLYTLDFATREPMAFTGYMAFAPTFSHDTSIAERLPLLCGRGRHVYTNWGLESARDTAVFDATIYQWQANPACAADPPKTVSHYGSIHQTIMLTGQLDLAIGAFD